MKKIDLKSLGLWQIDAAGIGAWVVLTLLVYLLGVGPLFEHRAERGALEADLRSRQSKASALAETHMAVREQVAEVKKALAECKLALKPAGHANR